MNVELCFSIVGSSKYLFKYVSKGSDRVTVEIMGRSRNHRSGNNTEVVPTIDEMWHYQDARYTSASGAAWRRFYFPMVEHEPSLERLEVYLEGRYIVYYKKGEHENAKIVEKEKSTKLIAYFTANQQYPNVCHIHYVDFPK